MKILTVNQVAELIQAKPSTVYAWAEQSRIPSIKINGLRRFIESEILSWLDNLAKGRSGCYNDLIQARSSRKGGRR
jgi:excisionase family DNA binding protein